jgi:hypothetical protein
MTEKPTFDPARSAAIRQLLIENVDAEPRRRTRHLRGLLAGLIVTGVLASGTTALALNRDTIFGAASPAATASPTVSATPTPAPAPDVTPSNTAPAPVTVSTTPIRPHDVNALPAQPAWSMELPGAEDGCRGVQPFSISDDFALFQVGPILEDEVETPCDRSADSMSLTLVDTSTGETMWTRKWDTINNVGLKWNAEAILLGTSGQILVRGIDEAPGSNEVVAVATGETLSTFKPNGPNEKTMSVYPVPGDSGDVYVSLVDLDDNGDPLPSGTVERLDPTNVSSPVWSTRVDGGDIQLDEVLNGLGYAAMWYSQPGSTRYTYAVLDLTTGEVSPRTVRPEYRFYSGYTVRKDDTMEPSQPLTLTGLDDGGNQLWTRTEPADTGVSEVLTSDLDPGAIRYGETRVGTGQFVTFSPRSIALVDGLSGETAWSVDLNPSCGFVGPYVPNAKPTVSLSPQGDAITIDNGQGTPCRFDRASGERRDVVALPIESAAAYGAQYIYGTVGGAPTAFDGQTGDVLWSMPSRASQMFFAGGRLVILDRYTLTSVD